MLSVIDSNKTKPWYKSKTIWGLILVAIGEVLTNQGVEYTEYLVLVGVILATIGRFLANARLTLK